MMAAVRGTSNRGRFFNTSQRDPDAEEHNALDTVRVAVEFGAALNKAEQAKTMEGIELEKENYLWGV